MPIPIRSSLLEFSSLPFRGNPYADESLMGFVLRMSNANGINGVYWLYKLLGKERLNRLEQEDVPAVASAFGAQIDVLRERFILNTRAGGEYSAKAHGHVINRPYLLRHLRPQLCPGCISEDGYAKSFWDFSMICACPKHGCLLVEACSNCLKKIQWSRPSLKHCNCGFAWKNINPSYFEPTHPSLAIAEVVEDRIVESGAATGKVRKYVEFEFLYEISLDTLFRLLWIFGVKRYSKDSVLTGVSRKIVSTDSARAFTERGFQRLLACIQAREVSSEIFDEIQISSLRALSREVHELVDLQFIGSLIQRLGVNKFSRKEDDSQITSQLTLF